MLSPSLWGLPGNRVTAHASPLPWQQCFPHLYGGCPIIAIHHVAYLLTAAMPSPSLWGLPRRCSRKNHRTDLCSNAFPILMGVARPVRPALTSRASAAMPSPSLWGLPLKGIHHERQGSNAFPILMGVAPRGTVALHDLGTVAAMPSPSLWGLPDYCGRL